MQPLVPLRAPKLFNLRSDPFERAQHEAGDYGKWFVEHLFVLVPAQAIVGSTCRHSRNFRRGRSRAASRSNRPWRSCTERRSTAAIDRARVAAMEGSNMKSISLFLRRSAGALCSRRWRLLALSLPSCSVLAGAHGTAERPLPSWNDGPAKQAILDFVEGDHRTGRARSSCRRRSASPPSTRTARCGSSIPCTRR